MKPEQLRANMAGYLDSASTLVQAVERACEVGKNTPPGGPSPHVNTPPAMFEQLREAQRVLRQCADWMLDPSNSQLEKRGG